jgi:MinD-like ATPase involved in chromosome partitioning or flagellar assembly
MSDQAQGLRRLFGQIEPKLVVVLSGSGDGVKNRFVQNLTAAVAATGYTAQAYRPRTGAAIDLPALAKKVEKTQCSEIILFDLPECDAADRLYQTAGLVDFILITRPNAASLKKSYLSLRGLARDIGRFSVSCVVSGASSSKEADVVARGLSAAAETFLSVAVRYLGYLPDCAYETKACAMNRPVVAAFPDSEAAEALKVIAKKMMNAVPAKGVPHRQLTSNMSINRSHTI